MPTPQPPSAIWGGAGPPSFGVRQVDPPVQQDAQYLLSATDRAYLDSQIRGTMELALLALATAEDAGTIGVVGPDLGVSVPTPNSSPYSAVRFQSVYCDTSTGGIDIVLPVLAVNEWVEVIHVNGQLSSRSIVIHSPGGSVLLAQAFPNNGGTPFNGTGPLSTYTISGAAMMGTSVKFFNAGVANLYGSR